MPDDHDSASPEFYLDQALGTFEEARGLLDRAEQPGLYGIVLHDIAQVHEFAGRATDAAERYRDAVDAKRAGENPAGLQTSLVSLASCLITMGEFAQAREAVDEAGELLARPGLDLSRRSRAIRVNEVGSLYETLGDHGEDGAYARALDSYAWALDLIDQEYDAVSCGNVLVSIGRVHQLLGHLTEAVGAYVQATQLLRSAGENGWLVSALIDLGRAYRLLAEQAATRAPDTQAPADTGSSEAAGPATDEGPAVPEPRDSRATSGSEASA